MTVVKAVWVAVPHVYTGSGTDVPKDVPPLRWCPAKHHF